MEKKMPLPSFSETFNMPSKILARFKDNPNSDDDLSDSSIFPNKCSCCWATEFLDSRVPSPIWNDTNFRIVSELTGLTSRIPECSFTSNSLECQEYEEFEEAGTKTIDDVKRVGSFEQICSMNNKEKSPSKCNEQDNVTDTRYSSLCTKCCSTIANESFGCEHQCKSSNKTLGYDGMPSCSQLCGETECAAEVSDGGSNGDMTPFSGNSSESGDGIVNPNVLEKPLRDINTHEAVVPEKIVSSSQKRCRREMNEIDLSSHDSNQENKKASVSESLKNIQQLSEFKIKNSIKTVEKNVAGYRANQPAGIINEFPCDKCQRIYKSKKTLSWHRNKNPDCKPPLTVITKNKSYTKQSVHLKTSENINKKSESNVADLVTNKNVNTNKERLKKTSASIDNSIEESGEGGNNVGSKFCSVLTEKLAITSRNFCNDFKINARLGDTCSKNLLWQCEMCVKCYKHKSSLQKHKKKSHPLE